MKHRIIWVLLTGLLIVLIPLTAFAFETGSCGKHLQWVLDDAGTLTISGKGDMDDYNYGRPWPTDSVNRIVIKRGVTGIGVGAFSRCSNLVSVTIPETVTKIGRSAFSQCTALKEIVIPGSVVSVGTNAFSQCSALTSVVLQEGVQIIEDGAFSYCTMTISLPSTLKEIGGTIPYSCYLKVVNNSYAHSYANDFNYDYVIQGQEKEKTYTATTLQDKVQEIVNNETTPDMSQYRKAVALHNWLCRNCEYDDNLASSSHSAASAILNGIAVCEGYTKAYAMLLTAAGIQNTKAWGYDHMWNVACLDGNWCHIDVTWDDGGFDVFGFTFFAVTDYALKNVGNHENYSPSVTCNNYRVSQSYRSGTLQKRANEWMPNLAAHIAAGETDFVTDEWSDGSFGIDPRMAAEMLQDTGFTISGQYFPVVKVEYNWIDRDEYYDDYIIFNGYYYTLHVVLDAASPLFGARQIQLGEHTLTWVEGVPATCETDGTEDYWICSHCGQKYHGSGALTPVSAQAVLRATGHDLEYHQAESFCDKPGWTEHWQCKKCGRYFSDQWAKTAIEKPDEIQPTGHYGEKTLIGSEKKDWVTINHYIMHCIKCNQDVQVDVRESQRDKLGDANGDGYVDGRDVIRILNWMKDSGITINKPNADANKDAQVDEKDVEIILQYLAREIYFWQFEDAQ